MSEYSKALSYAFLLLKYRKRSQKELTGRLERKFSPVVAKKVLRFLKENRFIDDRDFVYSYIESKLSRGFGINKIIYQLKRFGVDEKIVARARKELYEDNGSAYKAQLRKLASKRLAYYKEDKNKYQKLLRYLVSRGFSYSDSQEAINEIRYTTH